MIDGPNMYLYVHNNPVNWIDPSGLFATIPIIGDAYRCVRRISDEALRIPPDLRDPYGRLLHCIVSCRIVRECPGGWLTAWIVGDWIHDPWLTRRGPDARCDRKANCVGRNVARDRSRSCEEACRDAFDRGEIPRGRDCQQC